MIFEQKMNHFRSKFYYSILIVTPNLLLKMIIIISNNNSHADIYYPSRLHILNFLLAEMDGENHGPGCGRRLAQCDPAGRLSWVDAMLADAPVPMYRPGETSPAYYEIAVTGPLGDARGYMILSTGPHDHPIVDLSHEGDAPSRRLLAQLDVTRELEMLLLVLADRLRRGRAPELSVQEDLSLGIDELECGHPGHGAAGVPLVDLPGDLRPVGPVDLLGA